MLEEKFNTTLSDDYKMLMTQFGYGEFAGEITFRTPKMVLDELESHRNMWHDFYRPNGAAQPWFDNEQDVMTYEQIMKSILLGSSYNSDELIHCPDNSDLIYIISIDPAKLVTVKADFQSICREIHEFEFQYTFMPFHDNRYVYARQATKYTIDRLKCLDFCNTYWGYDGIVSRRQHESAGSWWLYFFVPQIGGEVSFGADDGKTHIVHERSGGVSIYQGNPDEQKHLNVSIRVDDAFRTEATDFLQALEASKLVMWD